MCLYNCFLQTILPLWHFLESLNLRCYNRIIQVWKWRICPVLLNRFIVSLNTYCNKQAHQNSWSYLWHRWVWRFKRWMSYITLKNIWSVISEVDRHNIYKPSRHINMLSYMHSILTVQLAIQMQIYKTLWTEIIFIHINQTPMFYITYIKYQANIKCTVWAVSWTISICVPLHYCDTSASK